MTNNDQEVHFVNALLTLKLERRQEEAIRYINSLSKEDALRLDNSTLTEIIRQFLIPPPILRSDLMVADDRIGEQVDLSFDRKTGHTNHSFFIPVERDSEWLEEVSDQRAAIDRYPLAFLRKQGYIEIRLSLSPDDAEGALDSALRHRVHLLEQYTQFVAHTIIAFNRQLSEEMTEILRRRKASLLRAERELERIGLPRVPNPERAEMDLQINRVLHNLEKYTSPRNHGANEACRELRVFIVHGHDHPSLTELKDFIQSHLKLGEPIVLRQLPGLGKTWIEKFEQAADSVELVFVLLTPDDQGDLDTGSRRARQNVILELGFFLGKFGRESGRVLLLHKGPIEIPTDIQGVEYIDITNGIHSAGETIRRELTALGIL